MCKHIYDYVTAAHDDVALFGLAMLELRAGVIKSAHPSISLFIKHFYKYRDTLDYAQSLEQQRRNFQEELSSTRHLKKLSNLNRGDRRGATSINEYIDSLFERRAKLLLVRVDLYYGRSAKYANDFDELVYIRDSFLRKLNRHYEHLFGYLWKLEFKESRGYMLHLLAIFDGNKVKNDILLGKSIGITWTGLSGEHTYYNCNADRQKYMEWGTYAIGAVHYSDVDKIDKLKQYVIGHFVKLDHYIIAKMTKRYRLYGKAEVPQKATGGRPRGILETYKPHISKYLW